MVLEASFENGKITFTPKTAVDLRLVEGIEDLARGRTHGPYETAPAAISALERKAGKRNKNSRKRK